jgi:uncharacterized membrane protein YccC
VVGGGRQHKFPIVKTSGCLIGAVITLLCCASSTIFLEVTVKNMFLTGAASGLVLGLALAVCPAVAMVAAELAFGAFLVGGLGWLVPQLVAKLQSPGVPVTA